MIRTLPNLRPCRPARPLLVGLLLTAVTSVGCASSSNKWQFASWDGKPRLPWSKKEPEKPAPQVPERIVATWADTTLTKAGQAPLRGFGGRLVFFGRESDDPVRVEGELVVYAFDETSRPVHETEPTRRYVFPADQLVRHESDSKLGPSYSFWLPWDAVGGPQRKVSLISRFQPKEGPIVLSEQTRHLLPGPLESPDGPLLAAGERSALVTSVRQAAYVPSASGAAHASTGAASTAASDRKQMATHTIALPARLGQDIRQPSAHQHAATLPLSQLAAQPSGELADSTSPTMAATASRSAVPSDAGGATTDRPPRRATAARRAAAGSLRDSLLETLPAQARLADRRSPADAQ